MVYGCCGLVEMDEENGIQSRSVGGRMKTVFCEEKPDNESAKKEGKKNRLVLNSVFAACKEEKKKMQESFNRNLTPSNLANWQKMVRCVHLYK